MSLAVAQRSAPWAMGLITACALLYQIAATRLLSVVLWYHFAFLSISVSMLGLGASGVWYSLRSPAPRALRRALLTAGISIPLSVSVIVRARPLVFSWGLGNAGWMAAVIMALLIPMIALGSAVCLLLLAAPGKSVARIYGADLLGATAGALLVIPCLTFLPAPQLLVLTALLPLAALLLIDAAARPIGYALSALIVLAAYWGAPFHVSYSKLYVEEGQTLPLHEIWTSTARITVFGRPIYSPDQDVPWGWGYGANFQPAAAIAQRWIDQDGSAGTPVERASADPADMVHLFYDVTSLGYQLIDAQQVCVIGAGGGRDVVTALAAGAKSVDAVEFNRAIVDLMRGPLAAFSGDLYRQPSVHAVVDEGRSFLTRTTRKYDLLQISLVDSWAATAAGAYSLTENYLYTVEAMRLYLQRLNDQGLLSVSRWTDRVQPFEGARLILLAERALALEGAKAPRDHLLFMSSGQVGTLIVGRKPLPEALRRRAIEIASARGFSQQWPPPEGPEDPSLVALAMRDTGKALAQLGVDLEPPVDDRPFFFQAAPVFRIGGEDVSASAPHDINLASVSLLRLTLTVLGVLALGLFFAPFALARKLERHAGFWRGSGYFALIGLGFMLLELPWIQQSILFLGHPSHAAAVVIASLLLGGGLSASLLGRLSESTIRRVFFCVPLVTAAISLAVAPLFRSAIDWPWALRCALTAACFGSAGLVLGLGIPLGFAHFGDRQKAWFWAINGAAGVFASALSVAFALAWGFRLTSLIGVGCYLMALTLLGWTGAAKTA